MDVKLGLDKSSDKPQVQEVLGIKRFNTVTNYWILEMVREVEVCGELKGLRIEEINPAEQKELKG